MKESLKKDFIGQKRTNKFIFQKKNFDAQKNEISPLAFMKGKNIGLNYSKSRNLINDNKNDLFYDLSEMMPEEFDFVESRKKSKELINSIKDIKDKDILINTIYKALSYDNTSQYVIYTALEKLYSLGYKKEYYELLNEYKMCISKEMELEDDNNKNLVNIEKFYPLTEFFIAKSVVEMKNIFIELIQIIILLSNIGTRFLKKLRIEHKENEENLILINENPDKRILDNNIFIDKFINIYKNLGYKKKFYHNQPIDYFLNPILYFCEMCNLIFKIFLVKDKNEYITKISFNEEKFQQIYYLTDFINKTLLENLKNNNIFTKESDILIKQFIFYIDSEIKSDNMLPHDNFIIKKNDNTLHKKFVEDYIKEKENIIINEIKIEEDKFIIEENETNIPFRYSNYDISILNKVNRTDNKKYLDNIRYKYMYLSEFQKENFFFDNELIYLKNLFREIINSKSFEQLYSLYSDKIYLPKNILKNKYIQNYILDNIIFFPYDEKTVDTQSATFNFNSQIHLSGYPQTSILDYKNAKVYHILELARKLIQLMHEYFHAIKRYLAIATNGLIFSKTYDENDKRIEAGFFFEYCFFGWEYDNYMDISINYKNNKNLSKKILDVNTSLKILNLDLYNNNLESIKEILYNDKNSKSLKNFENNGLNEQLKQFLFNIGFDSDKKIEELKKNKSIIKVGRSAINNNTISVEFKCGNDEREKIF